MCYRELRMLSQKYKLTEHEIEISQICDLAPQYSYVRQD